jgi:hypothetical protein
MSDTAGGPKRRHDGEELSAPLSREQLELLLPYGEVRQVAAGDVLFREGDASYAFFVVLDGRVAVVDDYGGHEGVSLRACGPVRSSHRLGRAAASRFGPTVLGAASRNGPGGGAGFR